MSKKHRRQWLPERKLQIVLDAFEAGYTEFGNVPFMVRQILQNEPSINSVNHNLGI